MYINNYQCSVNFTGKIIDAHAHIGKLNNENYTKEMLDTFTRSELPNKDKDIVEKMYVSNLDVLTGAKKEYEGNKETFDQLRNSEKYEVFASCSPKDGSVENIKRVNKEYPNKIIGLKFHPSLQNLDPLDSKYEPYMQFADKHKMPCLFHSAVNLNNEGKLIRDSINISDPEKIYELAKKHKSTPVVMAHMGAGWNQAHDKAIDVLARSIALKDANLYADISWVDIDSNKIVNGRKAKDHIIKAIKTLKGINDPHWTYGDQSHRLIFGSDAPIDRFSKNDALKDYSSFVDDIKEAIRNDEDLRPTAEKTIEDLFYNNAQKLYSKKNSSSNKKTGLIAGITGGVILLASACIYAVKKKKEK